ncbi:MAG: hypothetical protein ABI812_10645 [Betaproteobacteria bacterium]
MKLALNFPPLEAGSEKLAESRPAKVGPWLQEIGKRDTVTAARLIGDAAAITNRMALSDSRRMELGTLYGKAVSALWSPLQKRFAKSGQPLTGDAQNAARAAVALSSEMSNTWKRLLSREAEKRLSLGGHRLVTALIHRTLQASGRVLINSYAAYAPVPAFTWHDLHATYVYARRRKLHLSMPGTDPNERTPELLYIQSLLLALSNPYGFVPGQIDSVLRYLHEFAQLAKLTDVAPVHRMQKAVAIVPVGHDFPPFSANKGGSVHGSKLFLLTYDLAFQLQEQVTQIESGGEIPAGLARDSRLRPRHVALLKRMLRQWAIPPARQFGRLPARGKVRVFTGLFGVWQAGRQAAAATSGLDLPTPSTCQILNQTPGGYALRQLGTAPVPLRIGDLVAIEVEGRPRPQVATVRWFRNAAEVTALEFGCELVCEALESATAALAEGAGAAPIPVVILPGEHNGGAASDNAAPDQIVAPNGTFGVEQAVRIWRARGIEVAVLVKSADQGPDFEIFDYVAVAE